MISWFQCWLHSHHLPLLLVQAKNSSRLWFSVKSVVISRCSTAGVFQFETMTTGWWWVTLLKHLSECIFSMPLIILNVWIMSSRLLRSARLGNFNFFNRSVYVRSFNSGTGFVARSCIFSTLSMSFLKNGYQTVFPYSSCGLTSALYRSMKVSFSM